MTTMQADYDVVVVGAGAGGICAALAAARLRRRVLLIEAMGEIGGTGVHAAVSLICKFRGSNGQVVNNGIHRELFPQAYPTGRGLFGAAELVPTYDEQVLRKTYETLLDNEPQLDVWTDHRLVQVEVVAGRIVRLKVERADHTQIAVVGRVYLDATADGNLSAMAGADYELGRNSDGKLQSATVTFKMSGFRPELLESPDVRSWAGIHALRKELTVYYRQLKEEGGTDNPRPSVLCFPYPDGEALLFNATAVVDVDPTDPQSVQRGMQQGMRQVEELVSAIKRHPAFAHARLDFIAPKLGVREGRRIMGDYKLTAEDCLNARQFPDMVAACAYSLDIHDPLGGASRLMPIAEPGYYHIPYRSLVVRGYSNLLLASRCISGTHEAHSSYRVISGVTAIGEAAGTAAALAVWQQADDVREVRPAQIRYVLQSSGQFVEGERERVVLVEETVSGEH